MLHDAMLLLLSARTRRELGSKLLLVLRWSEDKLCWLLRLPTRLLEVGNACMIFCRVKSIACSWTLPPAGSNIPQCNPM